MLVNKLLLTLAVKNDHIVVKALDDALALEAVDQIRRNQDAFLSRLIQEGVLEIHHLCHGEFSFLFHSLFGICLEIFGIHSGDSHPWCIRSGRNTRLCFIITYSRIFFHHNFNFF